MTWNSRFQALTLTNLGPMFNTLKTIEPPNPNIGRHWTLLLVDARNAVLGGRYFDSKVPNRETVHRKNENYQAAWQVFRGARNVLDHLRPNTFDMRKDLHPYDTDINVSHQQHSNHSGGDEHSSGCGPFIWEMSREICQYIINIREDITLPPTYDIEIFCPTAFSARKNWDSM
jgi:hypothetical protein